jgi:hypothetical protein
MMVYRYSGGIFTRKAAIINGGGYCGRSRACHNPDYRRQLNCISPGGYIMESTPKRLAKQYKERTHADGS